jgi:hypothetical protein
MTTTQVLRKLFLGIAAAFSEAAGEIEEVSTTTVSEETPNKGKENGKSSKSTGAKRTRKPKAEVVEEDLEEVESPYLEESSEEESSEESSEEESSEEDFEEDLEEEIEDGLISEDNLKKLKGALNAYSAKNGKPAAIKVLHKFAKTSTEVKEADFAKIMKTLKV